MAELNAQLNPSFQSFEVQIPSTGITYIDNIRIAMAATNQPGSGRLQNKIAIVTGGSSSIGRAICLAYAKEGAKVVVADIRDSSRAPSEADTATHELIRKDGGRAEFMRLDVTDEKNVEDVVRKTVEEFGKVDMYVVPQIHCLRFVILTVQVS